MKIRKSEFSTLQLFCLVNIDEETSQLIHPSSLMLENEPSFAFHDS